MKYIIFTVILVLPQFSFSQETQGSVVVVVPYENFGQYQLGDQQVDKLAEISKNHVIGSSENQITKDELELIDVELVFEGEPFKIKTETSFSEQKIIASPLCLRPVQKSPLSILDSELENIFQTQKPKSKRKIYFSWGYNRNFHTKSDATFHTKEGTFTIHDAVGHDRPSYDWKDYVYPTRIPIPQYNLRVGYELNDHWDIVAGLDHMKWVFQNQLKYEVTGDYNHTVFVPHESGDPALLQGLTFDEVKQNKDMRWLTFDHTNGYNYVHLGGIYKVNLLTSKNSNFKIDAGVGGGFGLMIPQTSVRYHQDGWWNWDVVDNQFHIAGGGVHGEAKLQFSYKNFFLEPVVRGTYIKINNALVQSSGERLEHTPIGSVQFIVQGGYKIPLKERKKRIPSSENK